MAEHPEGAKQFVLAKQLRLLVFGMVAHTSVRMRTRLEFDLDVLVKALAEGRG